METNALTVVIWHAFDASQQSCRIKVCNDLRVFLDFCFTRKLGMVFFTSMVRAYKTGYHDHLCIISLISKLLISYLNVMTSECCCSWPQQYLQNGSGRGLTGRCQNMLYAAGCNLINPILVKQRRHQAISSTI